MFLINRHEEKIRNGTKHNLMVTLRYSPEKEASGLFSIHLPKRNLLSLDAYMNVTVPELKSCMARLHLTEISNNNYVVSAFNCNSNSLSPNCLQIVSKLMK